MAVHRFPLNIADIQMAMEMYGASPDGAAERERIQRLVDSLPDVTVEISGHSCGPDCSRD